MEQKMLNVRMIGGPMSNDSLFTTRNRLVGEGEQLVLHNVSTGPLDLVSVADIRADEWASGHPRKSTFWQGIARGFECENVPDGSHPVSAVWVPSGTYLILKDIPKFLQQRYGLEEDEGAIYLRPDAGDGTSGGELRFNNGALVQLRELRAGQLVEVLSLAGTQPTLYEPELRMK
jgi:hypothetical protein